ncbi:hypothetical protein CPC08DRAFT_716919 [Agrocybe pediades]|nr:hypothetical protein CPC08DRAFT_716919 [Agrocybe pediades]
MPPLARLSHTRLQNTHGQPAPVGTQAARSSRRESLYPPNALLRPIRCTQIPTLPSPTPKRDTSRASFVCVASSTIHVVATSVDPGGVAAFCEESSSHWERGEEDDGGRLRLGD